MRKYLIAWVMAAVVLPAGGAAAAAGAGRDGLAQAAAPQSTPQTRAATSRDTAWSPDAVPSSVVARASTRLPAVAQRIVSLDDLSTELLVSLGITPVAVANLAGYRKYVGIGAEQLTSSVALGSPQQPDLEAILRMQPDLVVGVSYLHLSLFARLDAMAPTILFDVSLASGARDGVALGEDMLLRLAELTGREARAAEVLAASRASLARATQDLANAGMAGRPMVALYPMGREGSFIVSNRRTLIASLLTRLGVTAPWQLDSDYSLHRRIGIEEVATQADLTALFIGGQQQSPMFATPMWRALPVARSGRFAFLPTPYWTFGGPVSAGRLAGQVVDAVRGLPAVAR
jgi:iron complex transport system substrate-binding protein